MGTRYRAGMLLGATCLVVAACSSSPSETTPSPGRNVATSSTTLSPPITIGEARGFWFSESDPNALFDLAVAPNGDVWTVGPAGATKWDTRTETPEQHASHTGLELTNLVSVAVGADGTVWAAGRAGVTHFDGVTWTAYRSGVDMPAVRPSQIGVGADGTVVCTGEGAAMLRNGEWTMTTLPGYTSGGSRSAVVDVDPDGLAWIVTSDGVVRWDGANEPNLLVSGRYEGVAVGPDGRAYAIGDDLVVIDGVSSTNVDAPYGRGIDVAADGSVWIAGEGVQRFADGEWTIWDGGAEARHTDIVAVDPASGAWAAGSEGGGFWKATDVDWRPIVIDHPSCYPSRLAPASDGTAWGICAGSHLVPLWRHDGSRWTEVQTDGQVFAPELIALDGEDRLWGAGETGVASWTGTGWKLEAGQEDWPFAAVTAMAFDRDGGLWLAAYLEEALEDDTPGEHIAHWDGDGWRLSTLDWGAWPELAPGIDPEDLPMGLPPVIDLTIADDGSLWISTLYGVFSLADGVVGPKVAYEFRGFEIDARSYSIAAAPSGEVWATLGDSHVGVSDNVGWRLFDTRDIDGLGGEPRAVAVAPDGSVWVGTTNGAARYDGVQWTAYDDGSGLGMPFVDQVVAGADGTVWFGTQHGWFLTRLVLDAGGPILRSRLEESWPSPSDVVDQVEAEPRPYPTPTSGSWTSWSQTNRIDQEGITVGPDGSVWTMTDGGLIRWSPDGSHESITPDPAWPASSPRSLVITPDGDVWLGFRGQVIRQRDEVVRLYDFTGRPSDSAPIELALGPDGSVWAASMQFGLARYEGGVWTTVADELPGRGDLDSFAVDGLGRTWVGSYWTGLSMFAAGRWEVVDARTIRLVRGAANGDVWYEVFDLASQHHTVIHIDDATGERTDYPIGRRNAWEIVPVGSAAYLASEPAVGGGSTVLLWRLADGATEPISGPWDEGTRQLLGLDVDAEGVMWFGGQTGLWRYDGTTSDHLVTDTVAGHTTEFVTAGGGFVWAGDCTASSVYQDGRWVEMPLAPEGLGACSAAMSSGGTPYLAGVSGIAHLVDGTWMLDRADASGAAWQDLYPPCLSEWCDYPHWILASSGPDVWAGMLGVEGGLWRWRDGSWVRVEGVFPAESGGVTDLAAGSNGTLWVATEHAVHHLAVGVGGWRHYRSGPDGPPDRPISIDGGEARAWVTSNDAIVFFNGSRWTTHPPLSPWGDSILIVDDERGVWLPEVCGPLRFDGQEASLVELTTCDEGRTRMIAVADDGSWWIIHGGALYRWEP